MNNEEEMEELAEIENKLILPVKPIEQDHKWDCGPTALRILVRYISGCKLNAQDMILLSGGTESGADEYNMMRACDALGFKYMQSEHGTLNILKKHLQAGQPSVVHLIEKDNVGHYVVFLGYDVENVYLADPATGKIIKYGQSYFLGIWKVEEGETSTRWYLTITGRVDDKLTSAIQRLKRIQKKVKDSRK